MAKVKSIVRKGSVRVEQVPVVRALTAGLGLVVLAAGLMWSAAAQADDAGGHQALMDNNHCYVCHMARGVVGAQSRWESTDVKTVYSMYSSKTADMIRSPQPGSVSLQCLSCHDGVLASNHRGSNSGRRGRSAQPSSGIFWLSGPAAVGMDLTDDHPISVTYDPSRDRGFRQAVRGKVGGLPLYGPNKDQLECISCHDPHFNTHPGMLRQSNDGSSMCLTCHDK